MSEALNWISAEEIEAKLAVTDDRDWESILYGEGRNGVQHAAENLTAALKQRGQHVRR